MLAAAHTSLAVETPELGRQLVAAARASDLPTVTRLLQQGADPNALDRATPIMGAAASSVSGEPNLAVMRALLAAGANVNARGLYGGTALILAARLCKPDAVRLLLDNGADPNLVDDEKVSPLVYSLQPFRNDQENLEIMRLLLAKGADVNATPITKRTALFEAVFRGSVPMVKLLVEHRADPNTSDQTGTTPLMAAVQQISGGTAEIIRLLANAGADFNARNNAGQTAAMIATEKGDATIVPMLQALGDKTQPEGAAKASPELNASLLREARQGHVGTVRVLLAGGADPNVADENGWTPLIHAADIGNADVVEELLLRKAHVDSKTRKGSTALTIAVLRRRIDIVRKLLAAGADVNLRNEAGDSPILIAAKFELVTVVVHPGPLVLVPPTGSLMARPQPAARREATIRNQEPELVELLIDAGADPNSADGDGLTPLMLAAARGQRDLVQVLLKRGADIDAKASYGITAWQVATNEEVIQAIASKRRGKTVQ
jgi:ankyrin repeat protein